MFASLTLCYGALARAHRAQHLWVNTSAASSRQGAHQNVSAGSHQITNTRCFPSADPIQAEPISTEKPALLPHEVKAQREGAQREGAQTAATAVFSAQTFALGRVCRNDQQISWVHNIHQRFHEKDMRLFSLNENEGFQYGSTHWSTNIPSHHSQLSAQPRVCPLTTS